MEIEQNGQKNNAEAIVCSMGGGSNALSIVRSLGREGILVHVIACNPSRNLAIQSRYCTSRHKIQGDLNSIILRDAILTVAHHCHGKPILYIDNDKMLSMMLDASKDLSDHVIFTSLPDHVEQLIDKKDQIVAARAAGLPVPESWFPMNWADVAAIKSPTAKRLIAKMRFPVVNREKPFKVLSAPDGPTLQKILCLYPLNPDELFIQEYVEGGDDDVYFALCYSSIHNDQVAIVTGRKLVQSGSGDGGIMVLGETDLNKTVRDLSLKMIIHLGYRGYFGIEFKYSKSKKGYCFIEVNTRPERINALGRIANIDLDIISYCDASGYDVRHPVKSAQQKGVWIDGHQLYEVIRRRREWRSFVLFLKALMRKKEWAVFAIDDIRPFWHSLIRWDRD